MTRSTQPGRAGLARGTEVRSRRAALKREIKDGELDALKVLAGRAERRWEAVAREMTIEALMLLAAGIGPRTIDEVLDGRGIPPTTRVYGLTDERRLELAHALGFPHDEKGSR